MAHDFSIKAAIICDDGRQEIGGKPFLIGVYASSILVNRFPVVLPTFAVYIEVQPQKEKYNNAFATIKHPNGQILKSAEGPASFPYPAFPGLLLFKYLNVAFPIEGKYEIYLQMDSDPVLATTFVVLTRDHIATFAPS